MGYGQFLPMDDGETFGDWLHMNRLLEKGYCDDWLLEKGCWGDWLQEWVYFDDWLMEKGYCGDWLLEKGMAYGLIVNDHQNK